MSESNSQPESQKDRWLKYGFNVVISVIVVIALAVIVSVIAGRKNRRFDTTASGVYSLKEQTVNIIKDLKQPIRLVSLYTRPLGAKGPSDQAQAVADLLSEYKAKGKNIEVELIDPIENPTKADELVKTVSAKYGGETKKFKEMLDAADMALEQTRKTITDEQDKVAKLADNALGTDEAGNQLKPAVGFTLDDLLRQIERDRSKIASLLKLKIPEYKSAVGVIEGTLNAVSEYAGGINQVLDRTARMSEAGKAYALAGKPIFDKIKTTADELVKRSRSLGELKLDEVRQKLAERDSILVLGESDMRSLSHDQVWRNEVEDARKLQNDEELKPRFAGEQMITSALLSLTSDKKSKVVFIRPGGPPVTSAGFPPFVRAGYFWMISERLREANFEVVEKDLSGQWAMQSQMQGRPAEPEPSDDEIKDALWIVLSMPTGGGQMGPPPSIEPKVAEHLKYGGSAMLLFTAKADAFTETLKEWGIEVKTDTVAVHETIGGNSPDSNNMIEQAQKIPIIFFTRDYGDHPLVKPLRSLDSVLVPRLIVKTSTVPGVTVTPILPVPNSPKSWGSSDLESAMSGEPVKLNTATDLTGPLYSGAVAEKQGGGRVVAIGNLEFAVTELLRLKDPELQKRRIRAARFPGNAELFANSVFWLAKMDTMIAISPAAMDVSRIEPMSDGALKFWRLGMLLIGLPGLVIVAGIAVYFVRRD